MHIKNKSITVFAMLALFIGQHWAMADSNTEVHLYTIKQSAPSVGTNFRKDIVKAGTIPLNKPYSELTDAQKEVLRSDYDSMPAGDEPPFPEKGLLPIYRAIGVAHENTDFENVGSFSMEISVDSSGQPNSVAILNSPSHEISDAATLVAMNIKYKPAVCSGHPCAMKLPIRAELISPGVVVMKPSNSTGVTLNRQ